MHKFLAYVVSGILTRMDPLLNQEERAAELQKQSTKKRAYKILCGLIGLAVFGGIIF